MSTQQDKRQSEYEKYLAESYRVMDSQTLQGMMEYNLMLLQDYGAVADSGSVLIWELKARLIGAELANRKGG